MRTTIIAILIFCTVPLQAQSDYYPFEEYIGGGIGYSPMFMQLDSIPGASMLKQIGLNPKQFTMPFVLQGGEGFTQIAGRWRIGGYTGVGATRISTIPAVQLFINRDGVDGYQPPPAIVTNPSLVDTTIPYTGAYAPSIEAKVSLALGAITLEYVMPVFRDVEIATGAMMGIGTLNIHAYQHSGTAVWSNSFQSVYGTFQDSTLYYEIDSLAQLPTVQNGGLTSGAVSSQYTTIGGTFFNFQPYIAIKWQIIDRMGLRISVGFHKGTIGAGKWYLNDRVPISDSPEASLQGISIRTMLYFGM